MQNVIPENKICKCCGKEFIPTTARQIFCCKQCSAYYHNHKRSPVRESKQCVICGTVFMPRNNRQVTCGKAECVKENEKNIKAKRRIVTSVLHTKHGQRRKNDIQKQVGKA